MSMQTIPLNPAGSFNPVAVPRHVVQQRFRTPKKNIPQTTVERTHILQVPHWCPVKKERVHGYLNSCSYPPARAA